MYKKLCAAVLALSCLSLSGCDEQKWETAPKVTRYADFNIMTQATWYKDDTHSTQIISVKVHVEPTRAGAYLVEDGIMDRTIISEENVATGQQPQKCLDFVSNGGTYTISVIFSDGKSFQRTIEKVSD